MTKYEIIERYGIEEYERRKKYVRLKFLKENNINSNTDHYKYIVDIINESTEYTYISI